MMKLRICCEKTTALPCAESGVDIDYPCFIGHFKHGLQSCYNLLEESSIFKNCLITIDN